MKNSNKEIILIQKGVPLGQYGEETESVLKDTRPIDEKFDAFAKSIGSFLLSFSDLEATVDNDLATAINENSHEPGYRIIKYLNFKSKINLLKDEYLSFISYMIQGSQKEKLTKELNMINNKLVELSEFRNKVVHADWNSLDEEGFVRTKIEVSKNTCGISLKKTKMTPNVLIRFSRHNISTANKMYYFREKVWEVAQKSEIKRLKTIKKKNAKDL